MIGVLDVQVVVGESGPVRRLPGSPTVFDVAGPGAHSHAHRDDVECPAGAPHPSVPAGLDLSRDYFPQPRVVDRGSFTRPPADAPSMVQAVESIVKSDATAVTQNSSAASRPATSDGGCPSTPSAVALSPHEASQ